ncbi:AraC family transcriptional regulator [Tardiphaga robiniae]|uniref:AraC family transcriptional regulator n=1 Tax=Tardiphaga robiniae TaxID=943830 RepID=A0A7G6U2X1_9BRAD|nr:AraC family transcriptional regulator [Tardiphaga robiniae]QND73353.1 AraC family transcriptional regulator [Tardiphaga robiniae]
MLDHSSTTVATHPLTEMLRGLKIEGVDYVRCRMTEPWGLVFPARPKAQFHFVAERGCWLRTLDNAWVRLEPGDAVLLPRGAEHALASSPDAFPAPVENCQFEPVCCGILDTCSGGSNGEETVLFGAGMTFNLDSQHPLLLMMPELMQMHELATDEPAIPHLLEAMTSELALDRVGAGGMLTRLADVVAAALIRNWVEKGCGSDGWVAAARDPGIGRVLAAIHRDPTRDWTVEALADVMHASRSAFALRFANVVGQTPARYVAQLRMREAKQWLVRDRLKIAVVARRLGYESEAAFSRAFKRIIGAPPSHFRATLTAASSSERPASTAP